jgi:hypothetical protein
MSERFTRFPWLLLRIWLCWGGCMRGCYTRGGCHVVTVSSHAGQSRNMGMNFVPLYH